MILFIPFSFAEEKVVLSRDVEIYALKEKLKKAQYEAWIHKEILMILECESGFDHWVKCGDGGKACGWAQWHEATFNELKQKAHMEELVWMSKADQVKLLDWALRHGFAKKWKCSYVYRKTETRFDE